MVSIVLEVERGLQKPAFALAINMAKWRLLVLTENGIYSAGRLVKAI